MTEQELQEQLEQKALANPGGYTGWGWNGRYSDSYVREEKYTGYDGATYTRPVYPVYPSPGERGFPCPEQIISARLNQQNSTED